MIKIPTKGLTYEEWLDLRMTFVDEGRIGGSDASTILGLNPWTSKVNRWHQSLGTSKIHTLDNEVMFHGRLLEDYVGDLWQYWTGDPVEMINNYSQKNKLRVARRRNFIFINEQYPWLFANLDREIISHDKHEGKGILEIKTISSFNSDKWEGGIPPYYVAQVQLYMLVMGYNYCDMAILKDGRHMDVFSIEKSEPLQNRILDESYEFFNSVQDALKILNKLPLNASQEEKYQAISHLEPSMDDKYKADLDQFLSEKHKLIKNRVKIDGDDELKKYAIDYTIQRDRELASKKAKQHTGQIIKDILVKRGAQEVDFGEEGKIVWQKTFNVKYKPKRKKNTSF
tara:strand:+ start:1692 stop:2714 length:1023 start_codon:yes stop_codon:yes gene_type:complete